MAKIKSYTDLEQSKKLAEILALESADMRYGYIAPYELSDRMYEGGYDKIPYPKGFFDFCLEDIYDDSFPCWSLSALLGVLPMMAKGKENANPFIAKTPDNEYYVVYATLTKEVDCSGIYDNPIDACVAMIEKLNELNLL